MAYPQTPRRLGARPMLHPTASSPNLNAASKNMARQASLSALVGGNSPAHRMGADGQDIDVGDTVDVPGGMVGVVKFVGSIRGKQGVFAGVELSREYAARGKNNGSVDGTQYFDTSIPNSGIFLPVHRAQKRVSGGSSDFAPEPVTPSYPNFSLSTTEKPNFGHDAPKSQFSQSIGPGVRATSPQGKSSLGRSFARPESPYRQKQGLSASPARSGSRTPSGFSKSAIGVPPRFASPAPPRFASPAPRAPPLQKPRTPGPQRSYSRSSSRVGQQDIIEEDTETTPVGAARTSNDSISSYKHRRPGSRLGSSPSEEVQRLQALLDERERQLKEQAASLSEMEASLAEIQSLIPEDGMDMGSAHGSNEPNDVAQLRALLREKNDKIAMLTSEFDAHRSDFRSTIDTLELASTETERVYEKKVEELTEELREYQSRTEDVETVAMQLKQLEELVQELEEGLEDARRGEAEARGEVEFLRGEVERGRSELRREREKAAAALKGAGAMVDTPQSPSQREVEQRDDEIRGLKAIIHSLSSGGDERVRSPLSPQGPAVDAEEFAQAKADAQRLEREKEELRGLVERKAYREEELEREIEKLKSQLGLAEQRDSMISNGVSEVAAVQKKPSERDSKDTIMNWKDSSQRNTPPALAIMPESDGRSSVNSSHLWCEICETGGHDILNCSAMGGDASTYSRTNDSIHNGKDGVIEGLRGLSISDRSLSERRPSILTPSKTPGSAPTAPLPNPSLTASNSDLVPPKGAAIADPDKWCALCESEGHDVTACPNEDAF